MSNCIKVQIGVGGSSIEEMNSVLHDESCDCSECLGIPSGVMEAPSWCPGCKQLRAEVERLNIQQLSDVTLSDWAVEHLKVIDELRKENKEIKKLVESVLVAHVEGREFMTSSQLHEAVIQDCTAALNVGR